MKNERVLVPKQSITIENKTKSLEGGNRKENADLSNENTVKTVRLVQGF